MKESKFEIRAQDMISNSKLNLKYTCINRNEEGQIIRSEKWKEGNNIDFPILEIFNLPEYSKSLALFVIDYDVKDSTHREKTKPFCHLAMYNILVPFNKTEKFEININSGNKALNSLNTFNFIPACPPEGETHTYYFRLLALRDNIQFSSQPNDISWKELSDQIQKVGILKEAWISFYFRIPGKYN